MGSDARLVAGAMFREVVARGQSALLLMSRMLVVFSEWLRHGMCKYVVTNAALLVL